MIKNVPVVYVPMNSSHHCIKHLDQRKLKSIIELLVQKSLKGIIHLLSKVERKYTDVQVPRWQKFNTFFFVQKMSACLVS